MKNKRELIYTHSRLQVEESTVFLAVNETKNIVEQKNPVLILDNERTREETVISIDMKTYSLLKEDFESLHGEKLPKIDLDSLCIFSCYPMYGLEDIASFVSLIEYADGHELKFLMAITNKINGTEHAIHIGRETYNSLVKYITQK